MRTSGLIKRNLTYFWQTNVVVILGVATAVAVLAGALLVGDSVRGSLREIFLQRLGQTDSAIVAEGFFREQLAGDLKSHPKFHLSGFIDVCPLIATKGAVSFDSGRGANEIAVYGVDGRFWQFHGRDRRPATGSEVFLSHSLATDLGVQLGQSLVLRVEKDSAIPVDSLHGRKEDLAGTLRVQVAAILSAADLGEFSLQPSQSGVRAVFIALGALQKELSQEKRANTILLSEANRGNEDSRDGIEGSISRLQALLQDTVGLEDAGINLRVLSDEQVSLETESRVLSDPIADAALKVASEGSFRTLPILSYLANSIEAGSKSIPYSLVTAVDETTFQQLSNADASLDQTAPPVDAASSALPSLVLNEWAAQDLGAKRGDRVALEYYLWHSGGRLETHRTDFQLVGVTPITGIAADRDLVPEYPGITESESLSDWDPPFPIDLGRVRKQDEDYWDQYRTTPKAFVQLNTGQDLWQSRFGKLTSVRLIGASGFAAQLRSELTPAEMGLQVLPVRSQGLDASKGATDFGAYFLYFSFFLVVSALLLAALFFRLGIEQRLREIGILRAIGYQPATVRRIFLTEGLILSFVGSLIGIAGALGYGALMILGLRTWWRDAVGTNALTLHLSTQTVLIGAGAGVLAASICIVLVLRRVSRQSTRSLILGNIEQGGVQYRGRPVSIYAALVLAVFGLALLLAASGNYISEVAGFFGSGLCFLVAALSYQSAWLRRASTMPVETGSRWGVWRLGFRNSTNRPVRSVLCIALIASAAFIIVAVDAFRRDSFGSTERKSGTGGYTIVAESLLPIVHDLNREEGREALNLSNTHDDKALTGVTFARFRLRPGDDASCLNLYQPKNPRILAASNDFIAESRFAFQGAVLGGETENPWALLNRVFPDGAVPVIADANSLTYVLHRAVGDDIPLQVGSGEVRLRVVAALSDSIFQSELLMSEANFLKLFPEQQGFKFFLIETPRANAELLATLEERLSEYGFDATSTAERLANYHRVENTYLSTFQMLGGLGLILGTLGMSAVLLRNVFEQRRELALLAAIGYNSSHFTRMIVAENALLVGLGLITGVACALLAIAPALMDRGGGGFNISLLVLLLAVLLTGLTASLVAALSVLKRPLLPALKSE